MNLTSINAQAYILLKKIKNKFIIYNFTLSSVPAKDPLIYN